MYLDYYGLQELPFRNTPDPRYFFWSRSHEQAFHALLYALEEHEMVMITGEIGTGKSTVIRAVNDHLENTGNTQLIILVYPRITPYQMLKFIATSLEIPLRRSRSDLLESIASTLVDRFHQNKRVGLIIDECHLLPGKKVYDEIRLLNNLQLDEGNLLSLILVGQPELESRLKHPTYRAFRQRISMHVRLEPLSYDETVDYIKHRWKIAGGQDFPFMPDALEMIYDISKGIPRVINHLAHLSLMDAFGNDQKMIRKENVERASSALLL